MSPLGSIVMTTSACAAASAALPNTSMPADAAVATAVGTGSNPRTVWPALTRFADIGPPMLPKPRKAIEVIAAFLSGRAEPCGLGPADDDPHDLVGALEDSMHPQVAHDLFQTILAQVAVATVQLQGLVGDIEARVGDVPLGHRAQLDLVGVVGVQRTGGPPQHHSRRLEVGGHVGEGEPNGGLVEQGSPERLPVADVGAGLVEGGLCTTERAGRDVDPAAVEALHRDAEAGALALGATQHRVGGNPHALQNHLRGGLGMPAHLLLGGAETQSLGALFDDEGRDAARTLAAGSCHHHIDVGGARTGDELLDAIQHVVATLLDGP